MESSRDSSVWRSLAVAFGDGLAFGVGVKLSQNAASLAGGAPAKSEAEPLAGRLEQLEQRLAQVERAKKLPPAPAPFDQKVLEAVVNALDTRLKEQAAAVDRRIAELEAKFTIEIKSLGQQDRAIASAVEAHLEELQDHFVAQLDAVRQQVERDRGAMHEAVASAVQAASGSAIEESLAPVRAEAAEKDREIEALRQRLEDSDRAMLDLLNGMGNVIRQAAERRAAPPAPPAPVVAAERRAAPPAPPAPVVVVEPPPEPPAAPVEEAADEQPETPLPAFTQAGKPGRLWRVPLVSSLAVAAFGLAMIHYL